MLFSNIVELTPCPGEQNILGFVVLAVHMLYVSY